MRIPIKDLREMAKKLKLSHVIVFATDRDQPVMQRVATYGHTKKACGEAADFGNLMKEKLGWPGSIERLADLKSQLEEVMRHRKGAHGHFCPEWDFLYIEAGDPEFEACSCFKEAGGGQD